MLELTRMKMHGIHKKEEDGSMELIVTYVVKSIAPKEVLCGEEGFLGSCQRHRRELSRLRGRRKRAGNLHKELASSTVSVVSAKMRAPVDVV